MINSAYHMKNQTYSVKYLHVATFSPGNSTWIKSIQKCNFQSWRELTVQLINKYLPNSVATSRGHIYQVRKTMRSTKPLYKKDTEDSKIRNTDNVPNLVFVGIETTVKVGSIYVSTHTRKITIWVRALPYPYGNPYSYGDFSVTVWI